MQRVQPILTELRAAFGALSQGARVAVGALALILACAFCSLGVVAAPKGTTTAPAASATNTVQVAAHATNTPRATATATTPPKAKEWVTVQHFTGNQNQSTPVFHVPNGAQIVWSASPDGQSSGNFSIEAYTSDNVYLDLLANTGVSKTETGTSTAHSDHDMYLKISALFCTYDIKVQVYQ